MTGVVVSRVLWAFRLFGLFSLFCASLYALNFSYQKYGNLVGLSLCLSLFLAANLPLQTSVVQTDLLFALADERGLGLVFLIFTVVIVGNFVFGLVTRHRENGASLIGAALLFMLSWHAVFFGIFWAVLIFIPGIILLGRKTQETYLWN